MSDHNHDHGHGHHDAYVTHYSAKDYAIGFVLSLILTAIPFWLVMGNVLPPVRLDASADVWPVAGADAIVCINMVHISPWAATKGLMRGASGLLPRGGPLVLYGPYRRSGVPTAPSNEAFDASLSARNPEWGLRDFDTVRAEAEGRDLCFERLIEMPANNLTIVFRRR